MKRPDLIVTAAGQMTFRKNTDRQKSSICFAGSTSISNTLEHWANDVSKDIAQMIQARCDIAGDPVPEHIRDFVENYAPTTQRPV
jgi:hypothetical protein